jgi:uncharacterized membrane protein YoaK (UPF0700 family)
VIRKLTAVRRTPQSNVRLGAALAFVAGATNAGGFLAVGQYTSHMTGIVSSMADNLALGQLRLALAGLAALATFIAGAMTTAVLVNWGRRTRLRSRYALPLLLEAALLLTFGLLGAAMSMKIALLLPLTVLLLCFIMGLQNAVITKISRAVIRTTHITGMVTDLGIELGKLVYLNRFGGSNGRVVADRQKLRLHGMLVAMFFIGGLTGALGFKHVGYSMTIGLAAILVPISLRPVVDDVQIRYRAWRRGARH